MPFNNGTLPRCSFPFSLGKTRVSTIIFKTGKILSTNNEIARFYEIEITRIFGDVIKKYRLLL